MCSSGSSYDNANSLFPKLWVLTKIGALNNISHIHIELSPFKNHIRHVIGIALWAFPALEQLSISIKWFLPPRHQGTICSFNKKLGIKAKLARVSSNLTIWGAPHEYLGEWVWPVKADNYGPDQRRGKLRDQARRRFRDLLKLGPGIWEEEKRMRNLVWETYHSTASAARGVPYRVRGGGLCYGIGLRGPVT